MFSAAWTAPVALAPSEHSVGGDCEAIRSNCARILAMTCGSSILAMIRSRPPQRAQVTMSFLNNRFSRRAQLIAT